MSSPASPLASDLRAAGGEPVAPVERERHRWTPIAAWMDWWLSPRWRALLTWAACAFSTWLFLGNRGLHLIDRGTQWFIEMIASYASLRLTNWHHGLSSSAVEALLIAWFQPIILRLGRHRVLLWIGIAIGFAVLVRALCNLFPIDERPSCWRILWIAELSGLCGFVMFGKRNRAWLVPLAAAVAGLIQFEFSGFDYGDFWLSEGLPSIAFGAILLYGTSPLPPKGARDD